MKKENVIDLNTYRDQDGPQDEKEKHSISEELKIAIQNLIYRLRELGPIR